MRTRNGFEELFCLRSSLSNDNIISAERPGLKTGVGNYIFWSGEGSSDGEPGGTPPPGIPRSTPLPWVLILFAGVEIYERLYAITESLRSINSV